MSVLNAAQRNSLPDSAFAAVYFAGGQKVRKFPIHDAAHVRDALSRWSEGDLPESVAAGAHAKILAAARKHGIK